MMRIGRLKADTAAATAIEYAIIAGLIGLGLVGSLVTTRGSLSGIFGKASGQMASGTSSALHPPVAASPNAGTWAAKTVTAQSSANVSAAGGSYSFTYSDGGTVFYQNAYDANGNFAGELYRITYPGNYQYQMQIDKNGNPMNLSYTEYYSGSMDVARDTVAGPPDWTGNIRYFTRQGSFSAQCSGCFNPSSAQRGGFVNDALYFRGLVNQ